MELRITPQTLLNQAIYNAQIQTTALGNAQEQAATGKKILVPSDDPLGTVTVLANHAQDQQFDTDLTNINDATNTLNDSVSTLDSASNILTQAKTLAGEGNNAATDPASYQTLASQVNDLLNQLVSLANTQNTGQYLYGGTATTQPPFSVTSDSQGNIQSVTYNGASDRGSSIIGQQQTVDTYYAGSEIFQQRQRGQTVITGTTGATAGSGTDSATGDGSLLVQHTLTSYAAGSGVQTGSSSASGDTILGPAGANQLTIVDTSGNGTAGTISLNNGPPVAFTNASTNLKLTGPQGEVAYVNTSGITPGFNGNVDITADGTLSVDGGATQTAITFNANQVVSNGTTGAVTNINSTNIRSTGTDQVQDPGTADAFQALINLRNDLNAQGVFEHPAFSSPHAGHLRPRSRAEWGAQRGGGAVGELAKFECLAEPDPKRSAQSPIADE